MSSVLLFCFSQSVRVLAKRLILLRIPWPIDILLVKLIFLLCILRRRQGAGEQDKEPYQVVDIALI